MIDIIGTVCKIKNNNKISYLIVLGYVSEEIFAQFRLGFSNFLISPYIYKDEKKVLSDYFDAYIEKYQCRALKNSIYVCAVLDSKDVSLTTDDLMYLTWDFLQDYLPYKIKILQEEEINKWVLKSRMLGTYSNIDAFLSKREIIDKVIKNTKLPPLENYVGNYMSLNYKLGLHLLNSLVIKQREKTYQVWYVRKMVKEKKERLVGYKLKQFKKEQLLDMLYYIENLVKDKNNLLEYRNCDMNYTYNPLDIVYKDSDLNFIVGN